MNIIDTALGLSPVPGLQAVFRAFHGLWNAVEQTKLNDKRLKALTECIGAFLVGLNRDWSNVRIDDGASKQAKKQLVE
jgi:hypothetical protein